MRIKTLASDLSVDLGAAQIDLGGHERKERKGGVGWFLKNRIGRGQLIPRPGEEGGETRGVQEGQKGTQEAPKRPQEAPRDFQEGPKGPQEAPRWSKRVPRGPKDAQRDLQEGPRGFPRGNTFPKSRSASRLQSLSAAKRLGGMTRSANNLIRSDSIQFNSIRLDLIRFDSV